MQNVRLFCYIYLLIIGSSLPLFAQENLVLDKTYFQGEIIRKVSVGDGAVWVIKGADSAGVGKLEPSGRELDYSLTINSAVPLTGIVGKYGDSAMIATKGNYLLKYDKGTITRLDDKNGIIGSQINDITGSPNYTRIATNWGAHQSYDNQQFSPLTTLSFGNFGQKVIRMGRIEDFLIMASITRGGNCFSRGEDLFNILIKAPSGLYQTYFQLEGANDLNALATNQQGRGYYMDLYLGNDSGLRVRHWECRSQEKKFLQDTAVYSIGKLGNSMLIGTEKGLFTCPDQYPKEVVEISLGGDYEVYDIVIREEERVVWLATNKGLLKLLKENPVVPKDCVIESLEWVKNIGSQFSDKPHSIRTDKEGNVFMAGYFQGAVNFGDSTLIAQNQKDFFIAKYHAGGELDWVRSAVNQGYAGKSMEEEGEFLALDSRGNVYVTMRINNEYDESEEWEVSFGPGVKIEKVPGYGKYMVKYDKSGTPLWVKPMYNYFAYDGFQIDTDSKDNLYLSLKLETNNPFDLAAGRGIIKYNSDFEVLWAKRFSEKLTHFRLKENGEFYLSGSSQYRITIGDVEIDPQGTNELILVFFDENAKPKWWKNFGGYARNDHIRYIRDVGYDLQGNTFIAGDFTESLDFGYGKIQPKDYGLFVAKINALGEFEWIKTGEAGYPRVKEVEVDSLGSTYVSLNYQGSLNIDNQNYSLEQGESEVLLARLDPLGNLSWAYSIPGISVENTNLAKDSKNNVFLSGSIKENILLNDRLLKAGGGANIFLAKVADSSSYLNRNLVRGKAYFDKNKNNIFDEEDEPVKHNIIKAQPGPVYAKSDEEGNYYLFLGEGSHTLDQLIPAYKGKRITQSSPSQPYTLNLSGTDADTAGFDFGHDVQLSPHLSTDVSSTRFRRCFTNKTVVEYCNDGFATAENVQLVLEYPKYVIPLSSSIPWSSRNGNTLTFDIGTLQAQQCKSITLTDSVMCGDESIRGLTLCIKASITPANSTEINPAWDQSDIELTAACKDNGFVRLMLKNTGSGAMADSAVFRIFLSEELSYSGKYKLQQEETLSLNVLANGKPLYLEAELAPFHPQKKIVSISIDGCEEGAAEVQHAFTKQFPQRDDQDDYELSCLEIIDSYDPNDKLVIPAGISANHYVAEESLLEYTIRFQNTGTDTAYTVVIADLLDKNLDVGTLEMGLSSHPVKWTLSGEGEPTIVWRFNKINLPDSRTDEKGSHGFVKFKIRPKEEAGFGTAIRNKAAIYFDYNSPIITNETLSTLGIPEGPETAKPLVQNCNSSVELVQEEDLAVVICEADSVLLSREVPEPGRGLWTLVEGQGNIQDKNSHQTLVEGLGYGTSVFLWEVSYCDVLVRSTITVTREALPASPQLNPVPDLCQDDPLPVITAIGQNIEWYADSTLTQLLGTGNTYQPEVLGSVLLYVTQQNQHCQSKAAIAELKVRPRPVPPLAASVESCVELKEDLTLTAEGNNIRWYAEPELNTLIAAGESFQVEEKESRSYYVTQSSDYCESNPTRVELSLKSFDPSKAFFANVVTPNGDPWNQAFYVSAFETEECLGEFIRIKVFDRLGKKVFESTSRDFQWKAEKETPGIYFYSMEFALHKFKGNVQVLP